MTHPAGGGRRAFDDLGSVAAEFAVTLPAVILVLACSLSAMQVAGQQLRLQDAASATARSSARGDSAQATASRLAPGSAVSQYSDGELECVTLSARSTAAIGIVVGFSLSASACALAGGR